MLNYTMEQCLERIAVAQETIAETIGARAAEGRYGDLSVAIPVYESGDGESGWVQWDPVRAAWREWRAELGGGWTRWQRQESDEPEFGPAAAMVCRAVRRDLADASPMSRGPICARPVAP